MGKKKQEGKDYLDRKLEELGANQTLYHFTNIAPFIGISIALEERPGGMTKEDIKGLLCSFRDVAVKEEHYVNSKMKALIIDNGIPGVSICDQKDQFSRKFGRDRSRGLLISSLVHRSRAEGFISSKRLLKEVKE